MVTMLAKILLKKHTKKMVLKYNVLFKETRIKKEQFKHE